MPAHPSRPRAHPTPGPCAWLLLLLGGLVLAGWIGDVDALKRVLPDSISMKGNTAVGFVFAGGALIALGHRRSLGRTLARGLAGLLLALAGATLSEHLAGLDLGIDQLLFVDRATTSEMPGRMALNTAICLLLAASALLALATASTLTRWRVRWALGVATALFATSFFALTGYGADLPAAYGWGQPWGMAIHTAIGLLLLACGLVDELRRRGAVAWHLSRPLSVALVGGVAFLVVVSSASWKALTTLEATAGEQLNAVGLQASAAGLVTTLREIDAEGDPTGATPATPGDERERRRAAERQLATLLDEHPGDDALAARLAAVRAALAGSHGATDRAPAGPGMPTPTSTAASPLRRAIDGLTALVTERVDASHDELSRQRRGAFTAVPLGTLASLGLIGAALALLNAESGRLRRTERELAENEERWSLALAGSDLGVWDWNARTNEVYFSPRWCTMLGYAPEEIRPRLEEWSSRVHPDDLEPTMNLVREHFDGHTPFYVSEHRMRAKDGSWLWILDRGQAIARDDGGKPLRVVGTHTDISRQRQAESARHESEERFRLAFDLAGVGMALVSLEGRFLRVNRSLCELVGQDSETMLGFDFQSITHADDLAADLAQAERLLRGEIRTYSIEKRYLHRDGHAVWINLTGSLLRAADGAPLYFIAQMQDISARKEAEAREAIASERLRGILDFSPTLITLFDLDGRYLLLNAAAARALGRDRDEVIGRSFGELLPAPLAATFAGRLERLRTTCEPLAVEDTFTTPDGPRTFETTLFPLRDHERRHYATGGIAWDVTEARAALATTERALAERDVLLRELHHRVKNNLQVISSLLSLQARTLHDPGQRAPFEEARRRVASMALIHDQLHRHRDVAEIDFAAYLRELVQLQRSAYGFAPNRLATRIAVTVPAVPVEVAVPCGLIANEWLSNAFKHAFPQDRTGTLDLCLTGRDGCWELSVHDDGVGNAEATQARERPPGLGLQLVSALARQLGGTVENLPPPGWGQRVSFPAPATSVTTTDAPKPAPGSAP